MDETPTYFDVPRRKTFDARGVITVKIKTTGYEKLRFTVVWAAGVAKKNAAYTAVLLPTLMIFKNLKKAPKGKFPPRMAVLDSNLCVLVLLYF